MGSVGRPRIRRRCLCWIFIAAFLYPVDSGLVLNDFIQHFEPVFYNHSEVLEQHQRTRRNVKDNEEPIRLEFTALNRLFRIRLRRDLSIFSQDAEFENSEGESIPFDVGRIYNGEMEDDDTAQVTGIIKPDGSFDGNIQTANEVYYFEPASNYFPNAEYRTVAYRHSDVKHPSENGCASHALHLARTEETRGYCEPGSCSSAKNVNSGSVIDGSFLPISSSYNSTRDSLDVISAVRTSYVVRNKRSQETNLEFGEGVIDKELYSGWNRGADSRKRRAVVDPKKKTCMLYLQADHLFYKKMGSEEACIEAMTRHVQRVNNIYQAIDFDGDGEPDDINFMIKRIKVHTDKALKDQNYRYPGNYGVEKFLELFSEEDYDAFCLAYMFTYRDFEGGTLGLAWTGDLKNAGGVCEKNGHYRGSLKSLNTGIITLLNYGKHVPPAVSHVTLAHEIGHNFGSPHDPENNKDCTPGGEDGNYIMFARATSGDKKNNNKFSPCSLRSINGVLNAKARDSRGCFTEPQGAICGNGVVEPGEECDCGWEEDCKENCCFPMRTNPGINERPCTLRPFRLCSPSQGPCCTDECQLKYGTKCRDDNGCRDASFCDGSSAECPASNNKPNKTVCNEEFVCFMGECTGSICLAYGLESCQCLPGPGDPPTKSCELCCKKPGDEHECLSSFEWNKLPYDVPDMYAKPGTPCNNYNGYCDVFQRCREVDPSGPLATLRRLLLSDESLASLKVWLEDHWYVVLFVVLGFLVALIVVVKVFGRRPMVKHQSRSGRHRRRRGHRDNPQTRVENGVIVHPTAVRTKISKSRSKGKKKSKNHQKSSKQHLKIRDKVSMWLENETVPVQSLPKRGSLDSLCDLKNVSLAETTLSPGSSQDAKVEPKGKLNRSQSEIYKPVDKRNFVRSFSQVEHVNRLSERSKSNNCLAKPQPELKSLPEEESNPEFVRMESQAPLVDPPVKPRIPKSKTETSIARKAIGRNLRSASLQNLFAMIKHQTKRREKKVIGLGKMKLVLKVNQKPSEKPKKKAKKKQVIVYSNGGYTADAKTVATSDPAYEHPVKAVDNISRKKHSRRHTSPEGDFKAKKFVRQVSEPTDVPEIKIRENPMNQLDSGVRPIEQV